MNRYLLDTHTWVWLMTGDEQLPKAIVKKIGESIPNNNVKVSIISFWEIFMLESKGRLIFEKNSFDWTKEALSKSGIGLSGFGIDILYESTRLPAEPHGDPFDRVLIATARKEKFILITKDKQIIKYGELGYVDVLGY